MLKYFVIKLRFNLILIINYKKKYTLLIVYWQYLRRRLKEFSLISEKSLNIMR